MKIFDNITDILRNDLPVVIKENSKVAIAASYFSIYAFQELKSQLLKIDELRFIFISPSFTTEKAKKEKREFYIPQLNREKSLYGTEFEIKLRNELIQKAIEIQDFSDIDFDLDDQNTDLFSVGKKVKIELSDMDYKSWANDLKQDSEVLITLLQRIDFITPDNDNKLKVLIKTIKNKLSNSINGNNKKITASRKW